MNDFLQSLRNGQAEKPRAPKTRKSYDNSYQYSSNSRLNSYGGGGGGYQSNRNNQMKRPPSQGMPHQGGNQMPQEDSSITLLADVLDNLSNHVEILVKNQEYMVNVQERTADMLERQAIAIERIVRYLNPSQEMEEMITEDPQPAFENHYVTSREPEVEKNPGNEWVEPAPPTISRPAISRPAARPAARPVARPMAKPSAAPISKPAREQQTGWGKPVVKKASTDKPVIKKRRKVVAKKITAPETTTSDSIKPIAPNTKLIPRDEVMGIIQSMRDEGATYDQVAKRLVDLEQPTFSGRGEWHAQTIHRLCSKK